MIGVGERYDAILDCVGNHSLAACKRVMTRQGKYLGVGGPNRRWMIREVAAIVAASLWSRLTSQKVLMVLALPKSEDLALIAEWIAAGTIMPVIDRRHGLTEVPDAMTARASRSNLARRSGSPATCAGRTLMATSRSSLVSRARYTSPVPPAPMACAIK